MKDEHLDDEEQFHRRDPKQFRRERKILAKKDQSKYKKTDLAKRKGEPRVDCRLQKGRVLMIGGDGILIDCEGKRYICNLRGTLKKEKMRIKNLIAVGDLVRFAASEGGTGSIHFVEKRRSVLSRVAQINRRSEQLIAVNIDQVLITASVVSPPLKPALIDRYIIAACKGNIDPIILINKVDLLEQSPEQRRLFEEVVDIYSVLKIPLIPLSAQTGEGIGQLEAQMKEKSSVFSGQSGTGKTSLINWVTGLSLLTGSVIAKTRKGAHTTTAACLVPIADGGFCVDTPGIGSFGMWDLKREEVRGYFSEIAAYGQGCKFPNCSHLHEPGCAVQNALREGGISRLRFDSYCALIANLHSPSKR